ncbi:MAG: hypothetical protein EH225_06115 [Calditrichaeota bacterium]|nr:hypothetical protein [Calditrichota bacterium]RQV93093.1 MAG: hypothetical protein EH221_10280 [bacterium]RQW04257.1 MAG: hypothetical protein EH225_06115 [Calditrichota bacterium]
MKKRIIPAVVFLLLLQMCCSQLSAGLFDDRFPSARATAMGGAGAAVANGVWASYYNPAGLSEVYRPVVGTSYLRLFNVSFFSNFFGATAYPLPGKYGTASLSFEYFGVNYKDKNLSGEYTLSFSHGFYLLKDIHSSLAAGYSLKMYHWSLGESQQLGDLGSASTFGVDVGLMASIYTRTYLGVYFMNINSPAIGEFTRHDLPQRVVVGLAYQPYDGVTTTLDFNRTIGMGEMQLWGGAEFTVFPNLDLRFGATTNPNRFTAGLGVNVAQFHLDYAIMTHSELGETHEVGLNYEF